MALGQIERESARLSELALTCNDFHGFQVGLLDLLDRAVGFDKAVLNGYSAEAGEDIHSRGYDEPPGLGEGPQYMAELDPREIAAVSRGALADVDILSSMRRNQLSLYRRCMWPERVTVFSLVLWRTGNGVYGINLARTGRGARFLANELCVLDRLRPMIRLADAHSRRRTRDAPMFATWADCVGLSAKERAVAALVVRGFKNPEIAELLGVSRHTVRNQLSAVFLKAQVSTRAELVFALSTFDPAEHSMTAPLPWMSLVP